MHDDKLLDQWQRQWPAGPPIADELKSAYPDRWIRFHSLPESKRYPDDEHEYTIILDRYNTILDELFAGKDVYVITSDWSDNFEPGERPVDHARWHPDAEFWISICTDPDPEYLSYTHLYVSKNSWRRGCVDNLLRAVADDATAGVLITDEDLQRIHHPYDGGMDVILATSNERDDLSSKYHAWRSSHQQGL